MAESTSLAGLIQNRIDAHLADRTSILLAVADDLSPLTDFSRDFLSGGKRFRARFCHLGWVSARGDAATPVDDAVVTAAAALEVFHAAALVHDDLIDNSDTRRGAASAHRHLEALHHAAGFAGDAARFGRSAALLTGDVLLAFSDELFEAAIEGCADHAAARAARAEFTRMRLEVTAGQYLDVLEENAWVTHDDDEQYARAERIIVYKSAKYSIEAPLAIGATLGGASIAQLAVLREFALPLGIAYQLRDDLLGVYGDPEVTGKPSGDDLREGKRTMLIALARKAMTEQQRARLDATLGDPGLSASDIADLQEAIVACGARRRLEELVEEQRAAANTALDEAPFEPAVLDELRGLADEAVRRRA